MEDSQIVVLYWKRDEKAISESETKYGRYCYSIADGILHDRGDAEECVNDTWLGAWHAMPPHRPEILPTFLGKITRRISLKKWRARSAEKRGGGSVAVSLDELEECIPAGQKIEESLEAAGLAEIINAFLETLPAAERRVFLRRYWYFDSVRDIALRFGFGESKVKMMLKRTRDKLLLHLQKEDIWV
ncbi:MAG: sigma-70 family RNA polymerase sigma factor [Lachnospiraceae bacterium]|nr:sigma-70 family RNA polymerase sigma factor [Lachnospiraceae bacterium]